MASQDEQIFQGILNELPSVLPATNNPDGNIRQQASARMEEWANNYYPMFATAIAQLLVHVQVPIETRTIGAVMLHTTLDAKESERKQFYRKRWVEVNSNIRNQIKDNLLRAMMDNDPNVRRFAAQLVGKIATIEIPEGLWNNVVNVLLNNVVSPQAPASLKQSTLECFGYICEGVKPEVLSAASDQILTAIIQGMRSEETDLNVKHAAAKALNHALEFSSKYFESDEQREFIMKVVIESAGMPGNGPEHVRVRKAAMECLVRIASLYYSKLMPYMSKIFTLTWRAIKEDDERVALQAIEFWSSICDEELDIKEDMEYNPEEGRQGQNFIKRAVQYLAPVLTEALLRGDDEPDPETWNVPQAAGTCLGSIARNVEDDVVAHVLPFVEANITDQNPRKREAAIFAFGSIMEGPEKEIGRWVHQALPVLLRSMNDSESSVKDSAAWTLGRIAQFHMDSIGNHFVEFINTLVNSLQDEPRVASNACFAINNVAEQFPRDMENHPLHLPFLSMCQNLAAAAERNDSYESNLRSSAYEALNSLVVNASNSNIENVKSMVGPFMERLDKTFHMPVLSDDDRNTQAELQGLLCGVLQSLCRRLESDINPFAEQMMVLFLRLFQMKSASTLSEEALMAVGSLINAIGMEFERFAKEFINYLGAALQNTRAYQVCQIAVGIVGDLSRALGPKLINFTDSLVNDLLKGLQDGTLKREVKPLILAALGDIALAVGGNFDRYFAVVMDVLAQASATAGNIKLEETEDIDVIDYMNSLRESICEAYSGIIQGLSGDGKVDLVLNYANGILQLLAAITSDGLRTEEVTRGAVGLLGDLVANLGSQLNSGAQIRTAFEPLLQLCESAPSASTRDTAAWARQAIEQNCK